jgi:hypothetical protein
VHADASACVYEKIPSAASAPLPQTYRQRQPHQSVLHRVVREHLLSFLAEGIEKSTSGEGYPYYVEKEFRDYLSCADLSRGFARVRCGACGHEFLLPFSCKNRGLCPSCTARRMSDEAAFLVDILLPQAPYRQWTVTFPWAVRYQLAKDFRLITSVLRIVVRALFAYQRRAAKRAGLCGVKTAAVTFIQRFGGALNLNVHAHVLLPDGVFVLEKTEILSFVPLPPPEDEDIARLVQKIAQRVRTFYEKHFANLEDRDCDVLESAIHEGMQRGPKLVVTDASAADESSDLEPSTPKRSRRCASVDGFSIHANTAVASENRVGLERLCRYGMRAAFSHERLSLTENGHVCLALRKPWPNREGVSSLCFTGVEFLRRISPLIPPPFAHLIRYHGLFAPNAKGRDLLPPASISWQGIRPEAFVRKTSLAAAETLRDAKAQNTPLPQDNSAPVVDLRTSQTTTTSRSRRKTLPWAELLRRVAALDVLVCPKCLGPMTVIAYLTDPNVLEKILNHLGLPNEPPPLSPARYRGQIELFEEKLGSAETKPWSRGPQSRTSIRAPPEEERCEWTVEIDEAATAETWEA